MSGRSPIFSVVAGEVADWAAFSDVVSVDTVSKKQISISWQRPVGTYNGDGCMAPPMGYKVYSYGNVLANSNYGRGREPVVQEIQRVQVMAEKRLHEVQTITITNAASGTFALYFESHQTEPIKIDATTDQVTTAINNVILQARSRLFETLRHSALDTVTETIYKITNTIGKF